MLAGCSRRARCRIAHGDAPPTESSSPCTHIQVTGLKADWWTALNARSLFGRSIHESSGRVPGRTVYTSGAELCRAGTDERPVELCRVPPTRAGTPSDHAQGHRPSDEDQRLGARESGARRSVVVASGIYRRSFIRAYAVAIGLEPDAIVTEFGRVFPDVDGGAIRSPAERRRRGPRPRGGFGVVHRRRRGPPTAQAHLRAR